MPRRAVDREFRFIESASGVGRRRRTAAAAAAAATGARAVTAVASAAAATAAAGIKRMPRRTTNASSAEQALAKRFEKIRPASLAASSQSSGPVI